MKESLRTNLDCVTVLLARLGLRQTNRPDGGMSIFSNMHQSAISSHSRSYLYDGKTHEKTTVGMFW